MREKTKYEIEMDYLRAMDQAKELDRLAADLSRIANNGIESAFLILKNNWRGDSNESIELAGRNTTAEIYRTAENLANTARSIRSTANIVYRAEKSALNLIY